MASRAQALVQDDLAVEQLGVVEEKAALMEEIGEGLGTADIALALRTQLDKTLPGNGPVLPLPFPEPVADTHPASTNLQNRPLRQQILHGPFQFGP